MNRWKRFLAGLSLLAVLALCPPLPRPAEPAPPAGTAMPPHPGLLARWQREGRPLPAFLTDPTYFSSRGINRSFRRATPLQGSLNALAVVLDFSDRVKTVTASYFDSLIFAAPVGGRGSVRDYFDEVSYGQVDIVTVNLPSSVGWVRAPSTLASYVSGGNYGMGSYPGNCQKLAEDIVDAVNSVVDFSNYDNDGDGLMEPIMLVHAGRGAEFTGSLNDIWSHSWSLYTARNYDGVTIQDYVIMPEYWVTVSPTTSDMTIGVFAHEMGHGFWGLPDLYDVDYSSYGVGDWSLMSFGSWNGPNSGGWGTDGSSPAWPDAWSRIVMGYDSYRMVLSPGAATFQPIEPAADRIARFKTSGLQTLEYFLLENRQKLPGTYDEYLPAGGLLIWHVDELKWLWGQDNTMECLTIPHCQGNCQSTHFLVALEQADGLDELEKKVDQGDGGDPFPGSTGRTTWRPYWAGPTNPESDSWYGQNCTPSSCIDVANIACVNLGNCTATVNSATCNLAEGDLGDAPASQNNYSTPMTAYRPAGPLPAVQANFPTVYLPLSIPGPRHHVAGADAYLGTAVTAEFNADQLPDLDGVRNISPTLDVADQDSIGTSHGSDDGLLPLLSLAQCKPIALPVTVTVVSQGPILPRYVNAWLDANRDGDWADTLTCPGGSPASEWLVPDQVFLLNPGVYPYLPVNVTIVPPLAVTEGAPFESWLRVSIAEMPAPAPYDGRGPVTGYDFGETEDYYLYLSPTLDIAAPPGTPAPGDLVTYTIQYNAQGNVAAMDAVLAGVLPLDLAYLSSTPPGNYDPGTRTVTWTAGLMPGVPFTAQVVTQLLADAEPCERITSTAYLLWGGNTWKRDAAGFDEGCPAGDPQAAFTHTVPACVDSPVDFTNLSTGTLPLSYAWDLDGDGLVDSTAQDPTWVYAAAADYTVTLTAYNCCAADVATATIGVLQPLAAVAVDGPAGLLVGEIGTYTAVPAPPGASSPSYAWDNGTTGITTTYSWGTPGTYTIAVTGSNACGVVTGTLEVVVSGECVSLTGVAVAGPAALMVGEEGTYTASPQPPTATNPAYLWSNGGTGASAVYSWTVPGTYDVAVTASNCQGVVVSDTVPVVVTSGCVSLTAVTIAGPAVLRPGEDGAFAATPAPPTATNPAYLWSNGATGASTTYSWPLAGNYTVTVTATNCISVAVNDSIGVTVRSEFRIYLPLVLRNGP